LQYFELRFQAPEVPNVEGFRLQELIAPGYQFVQQMALSLLLVTKARHCVSFYLWQSRRSTLEANPEI